MLFPYQEKKLQTKADIIEELNDLKETFAALGDVQEEILD